MEFIRKITTSTILRSGQCKRMSTDAVSVRTRGSLHSANYRLFFCELILRNTNSFLLFSIIL